MLILDGDSTMSCDPTSSFLSLSPKTHAKQFFCLPTSLEYFLHYYLYRFMQHFSAGFDPLGLAKNLDADALAAVKAKELNNGRLAMIATAGKSHRQRKHTINLTI